MLVVVENYQEIRNAWVLTFDDDGNRGILHDLGVLLELLPDLDKLALEDVLSPASVVPISLIILK